MKTLLKLLFLMAVISLVAGCNKTEELMSDEPVELKSAQPVTVTVPFEANLVGEYKAMDVGNAECLEDGYGCYVKDEATGMATHMGKVHVTFSFCACGPDDENVPGIDYKYAGSIFELTAANGDKLFLESNGGTVVEGRTEDHPDYVVNYWRDSYTIVGGTGRFKGAAGEIISDDYNSSADAYSHHHWTGTLILVKGKK